MLLKNSIQATKVYTVARIAWVLSSLAALFAVLKLWLMVLNRPTPATKPSDYWLADAIIAIVFPALGALIRARDSHNALGWVFSLIGVCIALGSFMREYAIYTILTAPGSFPGGIALAWAAAWVSNIGFLSILLMLLLLPNGRLPSRRWRIAGWGVLAVIIVATIAYALRPGPLSETPFVQNPFGIEPTGPFWELTEIVFILGAVLILLASLVALVLRFRHARGQERQQIKWLAFAAFVFSIALLGNTLLPELAWLIGGAGMSLMLVAIGFAVLRHRLWEIDVLISRTLVYGALTTCVVGIYVLIVGYLSILLKTRGILTENTAGLALQLIATGVVAVLFQPLREWLQRGVNRLLYGQRDEPYAVLVGLGQRLEATIASDAVLPVIVETVAQALKLPYVAIALPADERSTANDSRMVLNSDMFTVVAESGSKAISLAPDQRVTVLLTYQGEPVGNLMLAMRAPGETFTPADERLLAELGPQIGGAVHAVRLTAELRRALTDLQRSREQLVLAREEERRRLRSDLHDDLAPTLAGLALSAGTAAELVDHDPGVARALLVDLRESIRATVGDIRRLVYDLRPPALDELGLLAAIRDRAAQYSGQVLDRLHIVVEAEEPLPPLPAAVEVAAYRIVQEALMNVRRHACATTCRIGVIVEDGALRVEVADDGVGLRPDVTPGVGLYSIRERAEELGGRCVIEQGECGGTRVAVRLPLSRGGA
jgi:two-component system, NarL family, sensor kinase